MSDVKKNNHLHISRVNLICNEAKQFIGEIEDKLLEVNVNDQRVLDFIESQKQEVDHIYSRYLNHLEECSDDYIPVAAEIVDRVKNQTIVIKQRLSDVANSLIEANSADKLQDSSLVG